MAFSTCFMLMVMAIIGLNGRIIFTFLLSAFLNASSEESVGHRQVEWWGERSARVGRQTGCRSGAPVNAASAEVYESGAWPRGACASRQAGDVPERPPRLRLDDVPWHAQKRRGPANQHGISTMPTG